MKKTTFILILLLVSLVFVSAQSYIKVSEKAEYKKYLDYCNTPVKRPFSIVAKVSALQVNGQYTDSVGNWVTSKTPTITWVKYGTQSITFEPREQMVVVVVWLPVKRREPSGDDFHKHWLNHEIQEGLIDERSGISK